jgi:hypothetical protein
MPDFDSFERLFKSVVGGEISESEGAREIFGLPEKNKVIVVKDRSQQEIEAFLGRASVSLRSFFPASATFTSSDDNKSGKDLFESSTKTHIELKSGAAMTDANSGLGVVSWATGDLDNEISKLTKTGMLQRRSLALEGKLKAEIDKSKSASMDELMAQLSELVVIGPATQELTHYLKLVASGVTTSRGIIDSFGKELSSNLPLLLEASWKDGLTLYSKAFYPDEEIIVTRIERTIDRVQLIAEGVDSKRRAKIYPNFKNSWKAPDGRKIPASNWVNNPCFHVWIN